MDGTSPESRTLLSRFRIALAICILLGGLSLALVSNGRDGFGWSVLNELAVFAAAGVAIPFYYDLFLRDAERQRFLGEMNQLLDERLPVREGERGLTVHAQGRPSPSEKAAFIAGANSEIIEVGISLRSLASLFVSRPERDFTEPVRRLLSHGVNITYVVADPESVLLGEYSRSIGDPRLPQRASDSARQLLEIARGFESEGHPGGLTVRFTRHLPTSYISVVDPESETGRCRTSPYLAGVRRSDSPMLDISRSTQPELFERYATYARTALRDSTPADLP